MHRSYTYPVQGRAYPPPSLKRLQHSANLGVGLIPTLAAAGYLLCILSAVGRTGINPIPTVDACNTLAINGLSKRLQHSANVGVGFIPTLAAAGHLHQFLLVAGRAGINPAPTVDACNTLAINGLSKRLQHSANVGVGFIPTLAAAGYLHQFLLVAGRAGINPAPTVDACNTLTHCRSGKSCDSLV